MPRQSGYRVTIRGFLPADRKSLDETAKAIKLLNDAIANKDAGSRAELLDALIGVELDVTSTTRVVEDAAPQAVPADGETFG